MEKTEKKMVAPEVAEKEIENWLAFKKLDTEKSEENEASIKELANAISSGCLELDSKTFFFTHKLKHPIGDDNSIKEIKYKPRLKISEIQSRTRNVKSTDTYGLIIAYVSALTGENSGVIGQMDTSDYKISSSIAIFFL